MNHRSRRDLGSDGNGVGRKSPELQPASRRSAHAPRGAAAQFGSIGHRHRTDDPALDHHRFTQIEDPAGRGPFHAPHPRPQGSQIDGVVPFDPAPCQELSPIVGKIDGPALGLPRDPMEKLERPGWIQGLAGGREKAVQLIIGDDDGCRREHCSAVAVEVGIQPVLLRCFRRRRNRSRDGENHSQPGPAPGAAGSSEENQQHHHGAEEPGSEFHTGPRGADHQCGQRQPPRAGGRVI